MAINTNLRVLSSYTKTIHLSGGKTWLTKKKLLETDYKPELQRETICKPIAVKNTNDSGFDSTAKETKRFTKVSFILTTGRQRKSLDTAPNMEENQRRKPKGKGPNWTEKSRMTLGKSR